MKLDRIIIKKTGYELGGGNSFPGRGMHDSHSNHIQTGSGSYQNTYPVNNGKSLKLTTAHILVLGPIMPGFLPLSPPYIYTV
jgi:hypothetical protein